MIDSYILTIGGRRFDYSDIASNVVDLRDVAFALARVNRYCGHSVRPISVAEHTMRVFHMCADETSDVRGLALLHDASEAYLNDIPTPLKAVLPDYRWFERQAMDAIHKQILGKHTHQIPQSWHDVVKRADEDALWWETRAEDGALETSIDPAYFWADRLLGKFRQYFPNHFKALA